MPLPLHASRVPLVALALGLAACGGAPGGYVSSSGAYANNAAPSGGTLGANTGGAQDLNYYRAQVLQGAVPPAAAITVEGLFNQRDVPVANTACDTLFCLSPSFAYAPSLRTGRSENWVQLGMTSSLDAASFRRPPMDLVLAIDKGASMSIDLFAVAAAAASAVGHLREDDRVAVVTYDDGPHVLRPLGPVGDVRALQGQLRSMTAEGGSQIIQGLGSAFDAALSVPDDAHRLRRVMVFSCGYPDVLGEPGRWFRDLVGNGARHGVGTSFYGILLGSDSGIAQALSSSRGGAFGYFGTTTEVSALFGEDFDVRVTTLAYDLHVALETAPGYHLDAMYGLPTNAGAPATGFDVSTVFLSRGHGALVARLSSATPATELATVRFSYSAERAVRDEAPVVTAIPVRDDSALAPSTEGPRYGSPGVRKAVALVNEAERLADASDAWARGNRAEAQRIARELLAFLQGEATALEDAELREEVALVTRLVANMER